MIFFLMGGGEGGLSGLRVSVSRRLGKVWWRSRSFRFQSKGPHGLNEDFEVFRQRKGHVPSLKGTGRPQGASSEWRGCECQLIPSRSENHQQVERQMPCRRPDGPMCSLRLDAVTPCVISPAASGFGRDNSELKTCTGSSCLSVF